MKKKVQYAISVLNIIFEVAVIIFGYKSQINLSVKNISNDLFYYIIVAAFSALPLVYIICVNLSAKKFDIEKTNKIKVFPIIFVISVLVSWVICIYTNKCCENFDKYKLNWLLVGLGSTVMYASNFFSAVSKDNYFSKKMQIRISNEMMLAKIMKAIVCFFGFGGYVIIIAGAYGFFFKHWIIDVFIILAGFLCMIALPVSYYGYSVKKYKNKRKNTVTEKIKK